MAITHKLNQEGVKFRVKVTDCLVNTAFDRNDIIDQKIIFYKPNGIRFEKQAALVVDTVTPTESYVQYLNTSPEASILDLKEQWEYAAEITLVSTDKTETSQAQVFWVV